MEQLLALSLMLPVGAPLEDWVKHATLAGRLGFLAVHVPGEAVDDSTLRELCEAAAPSIVVSDDGADAVGIVRGVDLNQIRQTRTLLDEMEDARPLVVATSVSIGRTLNEAVARADREPRFVGEAHPAVSGIFGTFEEAQVMVLEIAEAGAEVLLVTVPNELDLADILAQVKALVVGATPKLFGRG